MKPTKFYLSALSILTVFANPVLAMESTSATPGVAAPINGQIESIQMGSEIQTEAIAQNVLSASGKITVYDADGAESGTGTGFFVAPDVVATNFHVIKGGGSANLKFSGHREVYPVVRVIATDPKQDLALLYVPGTGAHTLEIDSRVPTIGETVYVAGNPLGLEGVFSVGVLSSIRENGELQVTAAISPGNSGGPLLNSEGDVIGVVQSTIRYGQNLNFAIPVAKLERLLEEKGYAPA